MFYLVGGENKKLVGGFNPFEKYYSKWESSPNRGENEPYLKPPLVMNVLFLSRTFETPNFGAAKIIFDISFP